MCKDEFRVVGKKQVIQSFLSYVKNFEHYLKTKGKLLNTFKQAKVRIRFVFLTKHSG